MTRWDYRTDWNFSLSIISIFLSFFRIPKESYRDCCPLLCRLKYYAQNKSLFLPFSCDERKSKIVDQLYAGLVLGAFMLCLRTCALTKSVNQSTVSKLPNSKMGKKLFAFLYRVSKQAWNKSSVNRDYTVTSCIFLVQKSQVKLQWFLKPNFFEL